jgi:hypothetical protein
MYASPLDSAIEILRLWEEQRPKGWLPAPVKRYPRMEVSATLNRDTVSDV